MSTQNHSSLQMHIEDPQSKVTTDSQSNGSWSIEAKIGLAGLVLAVVIPLIGFIMRKGFWPSMIAILDRASHGSQASVSGQYLTFPSSARVSTNKTNKSLHVPAVPCAMMPSSGSHSAPFRMFQMRSWSNMRPNSLWIHSWSRLTPDCFRRSRAFLLFVFAYLLRAGPAARSTP
ncbi:uncharacterized protein BKA78DRAFT_71095 [Phyllosticta capitalensis]|uniref:uncharacterized protein n=1 Tax=Phyllosticta capitalensis TaxID=121624 RepID=UPI00312E9822